MSTNTRAALLTVAVFAAVFAFVGLVYLTHGWAFLVVLAMPVWMVWDLIRHELRMREWERENRD